MILLLICTNLDTKIAFLIYKLLNIGIILQLNDSEQEFWKKLQSIFPYFHGIFFK